MSPAPLPRYATAGRDALAAIARLGGTVDAPLVDCPHAQAVVDEVVRARPDEPTYQSVQHWLSEFSDDGLVERSPNPADSRSMLYQLTDAGAGVLDRQAEYYRTALDGECALDLDERVRRRLFEVAASPTKRTVAVKEIAKAFDVSSSLADNVLREVADADRRLELTDVNGPNNAARWEVTVV